MEKSIKFTLLSANLRPISATNCERAESNDFPTSSAFFLDLSGSILGLKHVLFRSLIHTDWILFSILLGHYFSSFAETSEGFMMTEVLMTGILNPLAFFLAYS